MKSLKNTLSFAQNISYAVKRWNGINIETTMAPYLTLIEKIKKYDFSTYSDQEVTERSRFLQREAQKAQKRQKGSCLDDLLPEAFALVKEACRRVLKQIPFDSQLAAAIVLHRGKIAQMATGEGKTMAAVFPAYLNALERKGVLIMTANPYLAKRDACLMGPVYKLLGLEAAYVVENMGTAERKKAYGKDIVYVTAKEAGFDYLRDGLAYRPADMVMPPFFYVIIDEADFIMIDEARIPLVIAGTGQDDEVDFVKTAQAARMLEKDSDYSVNVQDKRIFLTDRGIKKAERLLFCPGLYGPENKLVLSALHVTLYALSFLQPDVDYIIKDGAIKIVDEFTGRVAENRRWPYGIQCALEALHNLKIEEEGRILNRITVGHFISLFPKRAAATATAVHAAYEFKTMYNMDVTLIPPGRPCIREDLTDLIFCTREEKYRALVKTVKEAHEKKRPVLIGTASVRESETMYKLLRAEGMEPFVLNAKNDEKEAKIIADAGKPAMVTIGTNMAGRGTDIKLGGSDEAQKEEVAAVGGLLVLGTTRFESRRIDQQLAGRAGRQGDPGSTRFFISLEDDLVRRYSLEHQLGPEVRGKFRDQAKIAGNTGSVTSMESKKIDCRIARAQSVITEQHHLVRQTLSKYSAIIEKQSDLIRSWRMAILLEEEEKGLAETACPDDFSRSVSKIGLKRSREIDKELTLFYLDRTWQDHLEHISFLQEGIHLHSYAQKDPIHSYIESVHDLLERGLEHLEHSVTTAFQSLDPEKSTVSFIREKIKGPSSTITYLIEEKPLISLKYLSIALSNTGHRLGFLFLTPFYLLLAAGRTIKRAFTFLKKQTST